MSIADGPDESGYVTYSEQDIKLACNAANAAMTAMLQQVESDRGNRTAAALETILTVAFNLLNDGIPKQTLLTTIDLAEVNSRFHQSAKN